ncbi:MAG TPA: hypothetical protein PLU24_00560 [Candidatus Omnitrophota bacterium]|nr:hypothetical protein [Candidatus Omnitrophota bacterium]
MTKIGKSILFGILFCCLSQTAYARELKIVFTGQAYSALYPCACQETEGGLARRAQVIKQLRSKSNDLIVLEAGSSFASGAQDEYSQNSEADRARTEFYLEGIKKIGYDALLISSQEYSFGADFLLKYREFPFVSSNSENWQKAIIKDLGWIKVGILGITDGLINAKGVSGWKSPDVSISEAISDLKKRGAGLIIVLSSLEPQDDGRFLNNIKGIDIIINGSKNYGSAALNKLGSTLYLTTWWQARKLGILTIDVSGKKITKKTLDSISLDQGVGYDPEVLSLLPECFQDQNCPRVGGMIAHCQVSSFKNARCVYISPKKVKVTVVLPRECVTCRSGEVLRSLGTAFGDLISEVVAEDDPKARAFIKEFGITMLPAYIFDRKIEEVGNFDRLSKFLIPSEKGYMLRPQFSGVSYILGRKRLPNRLDVFFGFDDKTTPEFFKLLKDFSGRHKTVDLRFHFLAVSDVKEKGKFLARYGDEAELEELRRIACIDNLYKDQVYDYLICRSNNMGSSWWDGCLDPSKVDLGKIRSCATSEAGRTVFSGYTKLTQDLKIASGPTFIIDNVEIIGMDKVPSLENFEKAVIIKSKENNRGPYENKK